MRAVSIDAEGFARWRAGAGQARVHSVFERVVNLQGERGGLFALAAAGLDDAPLTAVVDGPLPLPAAQPGQPVRLAGQALALGRLEVLLAGAAPWRPVLPVWRGEPDGVATRLVWLHQALVAPAAAGSPLEQRAARLLADGRAQLVRALARPERDEAVGAARRLLGLGPGLTPAGDDFLAGLFAGLHVPGAPAGALQALAPAILGGVEERTNAISVAMLREAAAGRVRQRLVDLLQALLAGDAARVRQALHRVVVMGASSGRAMVDGVASAFELHVRFATRAPTALACA